VAGHGREGEDLLGARPIGIGGRGGQMAGAKKGCRERLAKKSQEVGGRGKKNFNHRQKTLPNPEKYGAEEEGTG